MSERTAYLIGWLEGFSGSIWAMCNAQEREVVAPEAVAEYEEKVKELREALAERPMYDTVYTPPIDLTPKITFKSGEDA